jgi:multiple sugar transport system ATP-binding protein
MASLTIHHIHKTFGKQAVLKGINISVADGEFLILVGASGCGKSSLLNIIAGLDQADAGDILIGDTRINDLSPKDRNIAMVFQSYALYPSMTVAQNIAFALEMQGLPKAARDAKVAQVAKTLQIDHLLDRKPGQLSGGQRQRVAMGRALARDPAVFLFDEPLSNLDAKLRVEMRAEIKSLHQRLKTTIVYVTHDQVEAMTLGDKIAVMREGQVEQLGSPAEIYERPVNQYVAGFIGSPSMAFLPTPLQAQQVAISSQGQTYPVKIASESQLSHVTLGIRPEHFIEVPEHTTNAFPALIDLVEPTGADTYAFTQLNGQTVAIRLPAKRGVQVAETIWFALETAALSVFDPASQRRV